MNVKQDLNFKLHMKENIRSANLKWERLYKIYKYKMKIILS